MEMPTDDLGLTSLCLWREARGEGNNGMRAVGCVLRNRAAKRHTSYAIEVMRPWQFTSMSDAQDPEYHLMPAANDPVWGAAQAIAEQVIAGVQQDLTNGATDYWNPHGLTPAEISPVKFKLADGTLVNFPKHWDAAKVAQTAVVGHHIFVKEV